MLGVQKKIFFRNTSTVSQKFIFLNPLTLHLSLFVFVLIRSNISEESVLRIALGPSVFEIFKVKVLIHSINYVCAY